jgi:pimeloyl-ACP methyl ester carboxylesterase
VAEVVRAGVHLHVVDRGSGLPVLFHTGGGGDHLMWEMAGYVAELSGCRHLLFDPRGHGESDKPTRVEAHAVGEYVADVLAVLDAVGVHKVAVVGYSDGAHIGYALAAAHPGRVAAIVGIGAVSSQPAARSEEVARAAEVRRIGFRSWWQRAADAEPDPPPPWLVDNIARTPTEMFALKVEAWAHDPPDVAYFPEVLAPTLIVYGAQEDPGGETESAAALLREGSTVVLPKCGHLGVFWRVDHSGPVIRRFLRAAMDG